MNASPSHPRRALPFSNPGHRFLARSYFQSGHFWCNITSALLLLLPPCFQVVALPSPAALPPSPQDSLTQFKKAWVRNVAAVRTQLGQTGRWGVGSDETEALGLTPPPLMSCVFTHMLATRSN